MEDILKRSQDNQDQMSSRVTALLAGSSLTTTAGVRIDRRDTIDQIDYTAVGEQILFFSKVRSSYHPLRYFFNIFISICLTQRYTFSQIVLPLLSNLDFFFYTQLKSQTRARQMALLVKEGAPQNYSNILLLKLLREL